MKRLPFGRRALVAPLAFLAACAGGVAEIPPASSPTSPRAEEARFVGATSLDQPDPLLTAVPPEAAPTAKPPESPRMRDGGTMPPGMHHGGGAHPGGAMQNGAPDMKHGAMAPEPHLRADSTPPATSPPPAVYTGVMHAEARLLAPGRGPKCGMTLGPEKPYSTGGPR